MYPHFIDGLATGQYKDLPQSEIERIVQENFFSFKPLIQLDEEQETILRQQATEWLSRVLNTERYEGLAGQVFYRKNEYEEYLYIDSTEKSLIEERRLDPKELKLLTPTEKIQLLSNPQNVMHLRIRKWYYLQFWVDLLASLACLCCLHF